MPHAITESGASFFAYTPTPDRSRFCRTKRGDLGALKQSPGFGHFEIPTFQVSKCSNQACWIPTFQVSFFKPLETSCSRCPQLMHCVVASFKSTSIANLPFLHCAWIFVFLKQCSKYAKNAILQLLYLVTIEFSVIDSWEGDLRDPKVPAAKTTTEQMATVSLL